MVETSRETSGTARPFLLAVVADGMGGHAAGAQASELAVSRLSESVRRAERRKSAKIVLADACEAANAAVLEASLQTAELGGMGTTLTAMLLWGSEAVALHVGDSRLYRHHVGAPIEQLSRDHTYVAELLRQGALSPDAAARHPERHLLTSALGTKPVCSYDIWTIAPKLTLNDSFLLCSDGLHDVVSNAEMASALDSHSASEASAHLLALALSRGAEDNVSVVVVRLSEDSARRHPPGKPRDTITQALDQVNTGAQDTP